MTGTYAVQFTKILETFVCNPYFSFLLFFLFDIFSPFNGTWTFYILFYMELLL